MQRWTMAMAATLGLFGCLGPAGPEGLQGKPGIDGKDGTIGEKGDPGDAGAPGPTRPTRLVSDRLGTWLPTNRAKLNDLLLTRGIVSAGFDPKNRPVAVFDWDNTTMKNDLGDATFFWMVNHDKILQPSAKDWGTTNSALNAAGKAALNTACDALASAGQPLPTSTNTACADALFNVYYNEKTPPPNPVSAWTAGITTTINQPYAWVSQLQAGYTPEEARGFAAAAFVQNNDAPIGATQTVGTTPGLSGYVRIYAEIEDLMAALAENGFDVYVTTASPQYVVEVIAEQMLEIPANHVIGIRPVLDANGKITPNLQGCGTIADGANSIITFDEGKRCWINKVIFNVAAASQLVPQTDVTRRAVFVAGDSDTDIAMLKDASTLKLAINRNKTQIMCNAYSAITKNGAASKWMVQPMFLSPKGQRLTPYPCSTAKDANGAVIVDEDGLPMMDQIDTDFALP